MSQPILSVYTSPGTAAARWLVAGDRLVCDRSDLPNAQVYGRVEYAIDETNRRIPPFLTLANSYVTFPVTPLLSVDRGDFSVSAWIRTANCGTNVILDHRIEDSGTVHGWAFFTYQGRINTQLSHPGILAYGGTEWCNYVNRSEHLRQLPIVADGVWHHVAVTIDRDAADGGCWYVDGELVWQFDPTNRPDSLSHQIPLTLGKRSDSGGGHFPGSIGGVGLYHWALTAAEVAAIYAGETGDAVVTEAIVLPQPPSNPTPLPNCQTCQFCSTRWQHHTDLGCAVNPLYWSQWRRLQLASRVSSPINSSLPASSVISILLQSTLIGGSSTEIEANIIPCRDYEPIALPPEPHISEPIALPPEPHISEPITPSPEPHISEPIALEERQGHRQNQASALSTPEKLIGVWNYWVSIAPTSYRLQVFLDGNRGLVGRYLIPADNDSLFEIRVYESSERGRPVLTLAQTYCCESQPASSYYAVLTGRLDRDDLITGSFVDLDNNQGTFTLEKQ